MARFDKIRNKAINRSRKCWIPFCKQNAINSHLLQKNGIINRIAEEGHVYQLDFYPFQNPPAKFKRLGINDAFTFKGFCSHHDDHLFKSIEKQDLNLDDYKTQLLFAYRAVINETRKKEVVVEYSNEILNDNTLSIDNSITNDIILGNSLGIKDNKILLKEIGDEIKNPSLRNFEFHHIVIEGEKLPICASGIFTYETTEEMQELKKKLNTDSYPINDIFLNILPFENGTSILIGCKTSASESCKNYINRLCTLSNNDLKKAISDILITRLENWVISPSFYKKLADEEETLASLYAYTGMMLDEREEIEFNIFDYL